MDKLELVLDVVAYVLGGTFILGLGFMYLLFKDALRPRVHASAPQFKRPPSLTTKTLTALDAKLNKIQQAVPPERLSELVAQMGMVRRWMDNFSQRTHPIRKRYFTSFRALEGAWRDMHKAQDAARAMPYRKYFGQKKQLEKLNRVYAGILRQERQAWETLVTVDKMAYDDLNKRGALRPSILTEPWSVKALAQPNAMSRAKPATATASRATSATTTPTTVADATKRAQTQRPTAGKKPYPATQPTSTAAATPNPTAPKQGA